MKARRNRPNLPLAAGSLLLASALLLGEAGWIPHGLKLGMLALACGLELWGCRRRTGGGEAS